MDRPVTALGSSSKNSGSAGLLEPTWLGLFDWIDRTPTCSFLQLAFGDPVGVDLYRECARECDVDGGDVALPLATGWLSLALDSQLDRPHRHQHVTLSVVGVVIVRGFEIQM